LLLLKAKGTKTFYVGLVSAATCMHVREALEALVWFVVSLGCAE